MKSSKSFLIIISISLFLITLLPFLGRTAIPQKINYQGFLSDSEGTPINGTVQMVFSIYDVLTGGAPLWVETQNVIVSGGVYNVNLGDVSPINLPFNIPYYLGVKVDTDQEMTPRMVLTSVAYAFRAQTVETISGHTHGGADITSGTISEARTDPLIARDSEVTVTVNAHAARTDNPHSTTAAQVGAVALNQASSITTAMIADGTITNADISPSAAIDYPKLSGVASATHNHDAAYVNVAGDTMTGTLNLPSNGLVAGTNQLVLTGGNVGIGTASPAEGGLVIKDIGASSDRTSISLDSSTSPLRRRSIRYLTSGGVRWALDVDNAAESGSNEGSYFGLNSYDDSGNYIRNVLYFNRRGDANGWGGYGNILNGSNQANTSTRLGIGTTEAEIIASQSRLIVKGLSGNGILTIVPTASTNSKVNGITFRGLSSGDMTDGFGSQISFAIQDNAGVSNSIAGISAVRNGADNSGKLSFWTFNTGTEGERMAISADGNVGIGAHPTAKLTVEGDIHPGTDDTYYLGKNDDDSPRAWKGIILKDTMDGKYYRVQVTGGVITAVALTD